MVYSFARSDESSVQLSVDCCCDLVMALRIDGDGKIGDCSSVSILKGRFGTLVGVEVAESCEFVVKCLLYDGAPWLSYAA